MTANTQKYILGLLFLFLLACGGGSSSSGENSSAEAADFSTIQQAAIFILSTVTQISVDDSREMGGLIYRTNGGYNVTSPVRGNRNSVNPLLSPIPAGTTLAGIYHTHPRPVEPAELTHLFSTPDRGLANQLGVLSFIGAVTGKISQYNPADGSQLVIATQNIRF